MQSESRDNYCSLSRETTVFHFDVLSRENTISTCFQAGCLLGLIFDSEDGVETSFDFGLHLQVIRVQT
jgi:hypothetical protein